MLRTDPRSMGPSPLLVRVIRAANHEAKFGDGRRRGEAEALAELARLALLTIPARGVLSPVDNDTCEAIHAVARRHLGYGHASRAFRRHLQQVRSFRTRDAIDTAHTDVMVATAKAHYYAGLAAGVSLAEIGRKP